MRVLIGCVLLLDCSFGLLASPPVSNRGVNPAAAEEKPRRESHAKPGGRTASSFALGIKTPGVRISFAQLKAEAEIPAPGKPGWLFFSESLFFPAVNGLDRIDQKTNKPVPGATAELNKPCGGMASGFGSLWVPVCGEGALARLDAKTYKVTTKVATGIPTAKGVLAANSDSIWMLVDNKTTLARIDPDTNAIIGELRLPAGCHSLISGESALWVACASENKVLRINPATNLVEKRIEVSAQPEALASGAGSVWVLCRKEGRIDRIDPKTNKVSKSIDLGVPQADGALAFGEGSLWVTQTGFPLTRINPETEAVAQQFYGEGGGVAIQTSKGAIWLAHPTGSDGLVWRIDPKLVLATLAE